MTKENNKKLTEQALLILETRGITKPSKQDIKSAVTALDLPFRVQGDITRMVLSKYGMLKRKQKAPVINDCGVDNGSVSVGSEGKTVIDKPLVVILSGLFDRAVEGDVQAARAYIDLYTRAGGDTIPKELVQQAITVTRSMLNDRASLYCDVCRPLYIEERKLELEGLQRDLNVT